MQFGVFLSASPLMQPVKTSSGMLSAIRLRYLGCLIGGKFAERILVFLCSSKLKLFIKVGGVSLLLVAQIPLSCQERLVDFLVLLFDSDSGVCAVWRFSVGIAFNGACKN